MTAAAERADAAVHEVDVAIVGGGLVGASLAVALSGQALRVALLEAAPPPQSAWSWDERCIALNDASYRILQQLGLWPALQGDAAAIVATHISERGRFGAARFAAADAGLQALGYNTPLRSLGAALWQAVEAAPHVRLYCPVRVAALQREDEAVRLHLQPGNAGDAAPSRAPDAATLPRTAVLPAALRARLVVAADGARSTIRQLLGHEAEVRDYQQSAIVSAVRLARPHQGVAYERFLPEGPLALIPKPEAAMSLVWTQPQARVAAMLALSDADYLAQAQAAFGGRLGPFRSVGRRWAYPLARTITRPAWAPRVVFVGNAAQSLHPVAAQGFNLGLRDVAALAAVLRHAQAQARDFDPGAEPLLATYSAERAADRAETAGLTDTMVRVFSNRLPGVAQLRHWGLVAVDVLPGLRGAIMHQHLGHRGTVDLAAPRTQARESP